MWIKNEDQPPINLNLLTALPYKGTDENEHEPAITFPNDGDWIGIEWWFSNKRVRNKTYDKIMALLEVKEV